MRSFGFCAVLLFCTPALRAQPAPTAAVADDRLRAWLATEPKVREKIARTQGSAVVLVEPDLKDAVADRPAGPPSPQQPACQDLRSCAVPPLTLDIPPGESVEAAIRSMLRPWILLADARGTRLGVASAGSEGQAVLSMNLQGLGLSGVELNIAPKPGSGTHLWFSRGLELAEIYARERETIKQP
ncbi:MAG: hypothetical protein NTY77_16330 [Elusimicrobia bacterium]|nr:hypothetical protein [Elusimicrobiota bacterium]